MGERVGSSTMLIAALLHARKSGEGALLQRYVCPQLLYLPYSLYLISDSIHCSRRGRISWSARAFVLLNRMFSFSVIHSYGTEAQGLYQEKPRMG